MTLPVFVSDSNAIRDSFRKELIDNEIDFEEGSHDIAYGISPNFIVKVQAYLIKQKSSAISKTKVLM